MAERGSACIRKIKRKEKKKDGRSYLPAVPECLFVFYALAQFLRGLSVKAFRETDGLGYSDSALRHVPP